jgi:hypothetical protein
MKLLDLDTNNTAAKALKANFDFAFDPTGLDHAKTKQMLLKVKGLIKEAKSNKDFYHNQKTPGYMKLVFMEQALSTHYSTLKEPRIVVENEEVEKSQVILAAQDMVDSIQKMIEEVNDMLVKELPALTDSIQSEIGANESQSFSSAATEALTSLNATLGQSKTSLQGALNGLTGMGDPMAFGAPPAAGGGEMPVTDIGAQGNVEAPAAEVPELPPEEPELPAVGKVGRAKR